jgi:AmmeMemoRadiSam system protein B
MDLRPSPIAGQWYSGQAASLTRIVDGYLEAAKADLRAPPGEIVGMIAPHAGHRYSGPVAAYAFEAVRGLSVDTVVIMCPSHFHDDGLLVTSQHEAYTTPLGTVPVDQEAIHRLRADLAAALNVSGDLALAAIRHDREHAVEIELPFLQRVLAEGWKLIPLMLREQSPGVARALGMALANLLRGRRALVVGSSDLSHYYPHEIAKKLDAVMLKQIDAFDPDGVLAAEAEGRGFACGHGAIAAALWAARELGANRARVLKHATSGDVSGDYAQVVGYGAAVIWKE